MLGFPCPMMTSPRVCLPYHNNVLHPVPSSSLYLAEYISLPIKMPGALGTTALPFWPALLFSYLEPSKHQTSAQYHVEHTANKRTVSLVIGAHAAITSPATFVTSQLPTHNPAEPISPAVLILAYTLGSLFLLLAGYALNCTVLTKDANVSKYYLLFAACGDVGHLLANYAGMESKVFWAWRDWNEVMWGNIAITIFLFVNRLATLSGIYGKPGWVVATKGKKL